MRRKVRGKVCALGKNNFGAGERSIENWREGSQVVGDRLLAMRSNEERGGVVVNGDEGEGSSIDGSRLKATPPLNQRH